MYNNEIGTHLFRKMEADVVQMLMQRLPIIEPLAALGTNKRRPGAVDALVSPQRATRWRNVFAN